MASNRLLILFVFVLVGSCSDDRDSNVPAKWAAASLPGVYAGVFPCDSCPGITTTLWLRSDGRFFFSQRYLADNTRAAMDAYSLGRWSSSADDSAIKLKGAGPSRAFMRLDPDTLVMQTDSELEHRLTRDPTAPEFSKTIRMVGTMRMRGDSASFTECIAGFVAPVSKGGDYARFRHQYRSTGGRGNPVFVELEGRFSWAADGTPRSMTIERFVTVKANEAC